MRYLCLFVLIAYLALLTFGLLSPDPFAVAGESEPYWQGLYADYLQFLAHFLAFLPLGLLACLGDWPMSRPSRLGLLVSYSLASEGLQHFIPGRTASLADLIQDVAGLAAGAGLWWVAGRLLLRHRQGRGTAMAQSEE